MRRPAWGAIQFGALMGLTSLAFIQSVQAQYPAYPGYGSNRSGWSVRVGVGNPGPASIYPGAANYPPQSGYDDRCAGGGGSAYAAWPSPAERQGFREGQLYWETGIAPSRPLSPAEARGFMAGERRAASTPWQIDPARQQGYREGQIYWETGQRPNRPLTPAEAQGFQAGENRAALGYRLPY